MANQLSIDTSSSTSSPLVPPQPSRTRSPLLSSPCAISSPLSRKPLWAGQDPARLAAREASIRARMERRRNGSEDGSRRSVSNPTSWQSVRSGQDASSLPLSKKGVTPVRIPRTPEMSPVNIDLGRETALPTRSVYPRAYSPFDVGLDRVRSTFGDPSFLGGGRSSTPPTQLHQLVELEQNNDDLSEIGPWTSYFNDPYRSPSASPVGRTRSSTADAHLHVPLVPPGGSPRLPWMDEHDAQWRGSSPTSSVRASTLTDLDEISKSLSKKSRRLSSASLLTAGSPGGDNDDVRGRQQEHGMTDFGPLHPRPDRTRTSSSGYSRTGSSLVSPCSPFSTLPRSRDSISSLMSLSTTGRATPIGIPPQEPLPLLPTNKKARRKIRVRPVENTLGGWEVDRTSSPGLPSIGLGLGFPILPRTPIRTLSPTTMQAQIPTDDKEELHHHKDVRTGRTLTMSTTPNGMAESPELAHYRSGKFGASEILHPTAPTTSVELLLPKDPTFMDLAGLLEDEDSDATIPNGRRARKRNSRIVMDFPLPPARGLRVNLETHPEEEPSRPTLSEVQPGCAAVATSSSRTARYSTDSYDITLDTPDLPACATKRKGSIASETTWDDELGNPMSCSSLRSSCSSQTTAPSSCAQLTPRSSLEGMPRLRRASCDLDFRQSLLADLDQMESLTDGNLAAMIEEVEIKIPPFKQTPKVTGDSSGSSGDSTGALVTSKTSARKPAIDRRPLLPPGPDAAYWGEPEIILSDKDFHSILSFDHPIHTHIKVDDPNIVKVSNSFINDPIQAPQILRPVTVPRTPHRARPTGLRQPTPSRLPTMQTPSRRIPTGHQDSSLMATPRASDQRVDRLAAFLPIGLGLTRLRSTAAVRAGSAVLRNVGRVGTAVSAYQYARPAWGRLTDRSSKNYEGHVPLNWFENAFLAAGSGVIGVADTSRGDLVALLSETSSQSFMPRLHASMKSEPEGRQILRDRPLIPSKTIDLDYLRTLRRGTLGREWVEWLIEGGVTPDTRHEVVHIDSPILAYTMTRYRQTHDLYHTLFSLPPTLAYELSLKVLELSNMSLPVAGLSSAFGPFRLSSARRSMWREDWMPWALRQGAQSRPLVGIYWEKRWEQGLGDLRQELGVKRMDDAAVIGRWKSYRLVREKERDLRVKGEWVDEPEAW